MAKKTTKPAGPKFVTDTEETLRVYYIHGDGEGGYDTFDPNQWDEIDYEGAQAVVRLSGEVVAVYNNFTHWRTKYETRTVYPKSKVMLERLSGDILPHAFRPWFGFDRAIGPK